MRAFEKEWCLGLCCLSLLACEAHDQVLPWRGSAIVTDASSSTAMDAAPPVSEAGQDAGIPAADA